ncbi:MAG: hypothetical protein PHF97_02850 [Bacteroidales bacterium]|nr:hypothetical protein [Bacteroidales bacterium]
MKRNFFPFSLLAVVIILLSGCKPNATEYIYSKNNKKKYRKENFGEVGLGYYHALSFPFAETNIEYYGTVTAGISLKFNFSKKDKNYLK